MNGHIYLIGFMGAGKSTVGPLVAERLERPFVDLDHAIETTNSQRIADIFADDGEDAFRCLEAAELARVSMLPPHVVACGGGIVLAQANRELLSRTGSVVYLAAHEDEVLARTRPDAERPLLTEDVGRMRELLASRLPLYEAVADVRVDTTGRTSAEVAGDVFEAVEALWA